jgi:hypothetical protein
MVQQNKYQYIGQVIHFDTKYIWRRELKKMIKLEIVCLFENGTEEVQNTGNEPAWGRRDPQLGLGGQSDVLAIMEFRVP